MTISDLLGKAADDLNIGGSSTPRLDALVLLEHTAQKDRGWLLAHQDQEVNTPYTPSQSPFQGPTLERYRQAVQRRVAGEPLAYITGVKEFYGLELEVSPSVLIPRPESEVLVDMAIELAPKNGCLIELGTGSGAIAIAIAKQRNDLEISVTDISPAALRVAETNAKKHGFTLDYINADLLDGIEDGYETIVANLPYVPAGFKAEAQKELSFEPEGALFGGSDGLELYRKLIDRLDDYPQARLLIIEVDPRQHEELISNALQHGWQLKRQQDFGLALSK